ncbi:ABC transporter permease [Psychrobacillus sp. FSL H8-0510]|uniref:ABC transporter permease n=1 Tax=Psychrobacillus sp. FSL H8-0510 TaxID=2921394 RepID=UPI0030F73553
MNNINEIFSKLIGLYNDRKLFWSLTKQDFKSKYFGSLLGSTWAFIQPAITIFIFWFVFQVGFKTQPISDVPFTLWLLAGIIPWFFISESFSRATHSFVENSYLVSKIAFRISILPLVRIVTSLFIHLFFLFVLLVILILYGYTPSIYWLQILYFLVCMVILSTTLSILTSTLYVFFRDMAYIVGVVIQVGFWITPIFWSSNILPEKFVVFIKLNPFYYLVEGYRLSFFENQWFWVSDIYLTLYFWSFIILTTIVGFILYKVLRPHFADVL